MVEIYLWLDKHALKKTSKKLWQIIKLWFKMFPPVVPNTQALKVCWRHRSLRSVAASGATRTRSMPRPWMMKMICRRILFAEFFVCQKKTPSFCASFSKAKACIWYLKNHLSDDGFGYQNTWFRTVALLVCCCMDAPFSNGWCEWTMPYMRYNSQSFESFTIWWGFEISHFFNDSNETMPVIFTNFAWGGGRWRRWPEAVGMCWQRWHGHLYWLHREETGLPASQIAHMDRDREHGWKSGKSYEWKHPVSKQSSHHGQTGGHGRWRLDQLQGGADGASRPMEPRPPGAGRALSLESRCAKHFASKAHKSWFELLESGYAEGQDLPEVYRGGRQFGGDMSDIMYCRRQTGTNTTNFYFSTQGVS